MRITMDGQSLTAAPGQTLAAVLIANGRRYWRTTRAQGRPRGVFCGIGACHDCLVVVNGVTDIRACQRLVADGDVVRSQDGAELPS